MNLIGGAVALKKNFSLPRVVAIVFLPIFFLFFSQTATLLASPTSEQPVQATLLAEEESVKAGRSFWVGVELKMASGWDTYWMNPGDSGFATQINWTLPEGFHAGPLLWPYPQKFTNDSFVAFGYTGTVLLLTEITPPEKLPSDQKFTIQADVNWLACKDACIPGEQRVTVTLPVSDSTPSLNSQSTHLFVQAKESLPHPLKSNEGKLTVQELTDKIVLDFIPQPGSLGEIESLLFIPEEGEIVDYSAPQDIQRLNNGVILNVKKAHPETALSQVKGVLIVSEKGSDIKRAIQVDSPVMTRATSVSEAGALSFSLAVAFAFLGGLILNVMPCVLPVIALKIFSFVKMAQQKRMLIFKHGIAFSSGVVISFWVLSGILLILRAYGEGIGWGFQLQEPIFVIALTAILFLLGLSLFGVFEVGTSLISVAQKGGVSGEKSPLGSSFMSGVLATLVATPCTGPLLGPALGFAMTLPPVSALFIFTAMGLGMAFPYLLFSAFPALVRFLPKPGNWMIVFKQLMGFLMMGTVIWLIWVFGAQTDNMTTFVLLLSLLFMAIGGWIFGKWGTPMHRKLTRMTAMIGAALIILFGGALSMTAAKNYQNVESSTERVSLVSTSGWEAYSPERVAHLRSQGQAVFVDFTAKWCLICQANKVVLNSVEVQGAFKEKDVVLMVGDWTKKDPQISEELNKLGRSGVPVYALYPADVTKVPHILPQTLTAKTVQEHLAKLPQANHPETVHVD